MTEIEKQEKDQQNKINFLKANLIKIQPLLKDKMILEIMLNQDGVIRVDVVGKGKMKTDIYLSQMEGKRIIEVVASYAGTAVTKDKPIVEATLPDGERFSGILYGSTQGLPTFSIRKKSEYIIPLEKYIENKTITKSQAEFLEQAVLGRKNILIVGGTSSGKTTFANAILKGLSNTKDRVLVLEEVRELQVNTDDVNYYTATNELNIQDLLRFCMRMTPDRIIVGELRKGEECMEMLKAWNSGHNGGIATIHANGAKEGLIKVEQYLGEVSEKSQVNLIVDAIDVVVSLVKEESVRRVKEVAILKGFNFKENEYVLERID